MILKDTIHQVVLSQKEILEKKDAGLFREKLKSLPALSSHALIISGIRRCGKSTLLYQLLKTKYKKALYVNFEDPRLYGFNPNDFLQLDEVIASLKINTLLFDEIQNIPEWENYIRYKLDQGNKIIITGSNASLLSKELGTKLTGRHITYELFPFSYNEYCGFLHKKPDAVQTEKYLNTGGFPEFIKTKNETILLQAFDDVIIRDIAIRHNIRNLQAIQELAIWLISNVGKPVSANSLIKFLPIASVSSVVEYLSYLSQSYLFSFIPKFSYSIKNQLVNSKKVYAVDTGLTHTNSRSFSSDDGRLFENLVFMHLRNNYKEIYYFQEKQECDFVVFENRKVKSVIQACSDLNVHTQKRETDGLLEAMEFFKIRHGVIVTISQSNKIKIKDKVIYVIPFHEWVAVSF